MDIRNLLMGEPVYDDNGNIVRRDFGIKNAAFILVIGCIGYSLISGCKVKSGKRKMKGGVEWPKLPDCDLACVGAIALVAIFSLVVGGLDYAADAWDKKHS